MIMLGECRSGDEGAAAHTDTAANTDTAGHTAYMRLRGGNTLGLRGEHGLGQDTADDACEGHAAGCELGDGREKKDAPEDEEGGGGVLGLAEGLLVDEAEDGEGECAPHDAGCQRGRRGGDVHGLLDEHAGGGRGHRGLAVPVVVLGPLGGEGEVVREQLLALRGGLVQHGRGHRRCVCGEEEQRIINTDSRANTLKFPRLVVHSTSTLVSTKPSCPPPPAPRSRSASSAQPAQSASGKHPPPPPPSRSPRSPATSFIELLAAHPYFSIHALGASSRSAGQQYAKIVRWKLATPIPDSVRHMVVQECKPDAPGFAECGVVFSGLDADVAGDIGQSLCSLDRTPARQH